MHEVGQQGAYQALYKHGGDACLIAPHGSGRSEGT